MKLNLTASIKPFSKSQVIDNALNLQFAAEIPTALKCQPINIRVFGLRKHKKDHNHHHLFKSCDYGDHVKGTIDKNVQWISSTLNNQSRVCKPNHVGKFTTWQFHLIRVYLFFIFSPYSHLTHRFFSPYSRVSDTHL